VPIPDRPIAVCQIAPQLPDIAPVTGAQQAVAGRASVAKRVVSNQGEQPFYSTSSVPRSAVVAHGGARKSNLRQ